MNRIALALALALCLALFAGAASADPPIEIEITAAGPITINGQEIAPEGTMTTIGIQIGVETTSIIPDTTPPDAPSAPSLEAGDTEITVTLPALSGDVAGFRVYTAATEGGSYTEDTSSLATGTHVIDGLTNDVAVYVKISAEDEAGNESALSAASTATPEAPAPAWTPADHESTLEWFGMSAADSASVVHGDVSGVDRLEQATSLLGTGRTLTSASASERPAYADGAYFRAADVGTVHHMDFSERIVCTGGDFALYLVVEFQATGYGYMLRERVGSDYQFGIWSDGDAHVEIYGTLKRFDAGLATTAGTRLLALHKSGTTFSIEEDGAQKYTDSVSFASIRGFELEEMGLQSGGGLASQGITIKEIILVDEALGTDDQALFEGYLATKFGLTLP